MNQMRIRQSGFTTAAIVLALACAQGPPEYGAGWGQGPSLPEPVQELHGAILHGCIYVAGGIARGSVVSRHVYRLDPDLSAWSRVADLPAPRHHMPLAVAADSLYAIGVYDP